MNRQDKDIIDVVRKVAQREISAEGGLEIIRDIARGADAKASAQASAVFCHTAWIENDLDETVGDTGGSVVFVRSGESCEDAFLERARNAGCHVIEVVRGSSYARLGDATFELNTLEDGDFRRLFGELEKEGTNVGGVVLFVTPDFQPGEESGVSEGMEAGFYPLNAISRALSALKPSGNIRILCVAERDSVVGADPLFGALSGFGRSAHLENTKLGYKFVTVPSEASFSDMSRRLFSELVSWHAPVSEVRYEGEQRFERRLKELDAGTSTDTGSPLRDGGVYLITGGLGGLGMIFARHLSSKYKANLILSGRRERDGRVDELLDELSGNGGDAIYVRCDVAKREEVRALLAVGRERFGRIDGIFHAAGVLRDALMGKKRPEDIASVIGPKVQGTINLDAESRDDDLSAFILFSSIAGVTGNIGQTDYAFANRFMDGFARWREGKRKERTRSGRSMAIAWPLWESGGMHVDEETREWLRQSMGIVPLSAAEGLHIFERALHFSIDQLAVFYGVERKIKGALSAESDLQSSTTVTDSPAVSGEMGEELLGKVREDVVGLVGDILKIRESDIDIDADMSEYGFDSITVTTLTNMLNAKYDIGLRPAIFFEHPSIASMVEYVISEYAGELCRHYDLSRRVGDADEGRKASRPVPNGRKSRKTALRRSGFATDMRASEPVAVIGMSGIFPQSDTVDEFWRHLEGCDDLITEIPIDRWDWKKYYGDQSTEKNKTRAKWGGFVREVDKFDAAFFNISPYEAELMDPQQRIFMEVVWKTLEDAGYSASSVSGSKTGLFVGVSTSDYNELLQKKGISIEAHTSTGVAHSVLANRISYLLDIHGPSEPVDTACSSSLIAIHRAVCAIQVGDCEMAIAGGVSAILTPTAHISFSKAGMLSKDGRCRTFDKEANGYVRGEGAGAVFLKPLSKAVRDRDHIYAVIRSTGENHGGHVSSLTVPNPLAQAQLLEDVYDRAEIEPWRIGYIECHGTGTSLGDPVEVNGLKRAFTAMYGKYGKDFNGEPYCGLGTVKTNIGHLEAAAGIAGFIKVLLAMQHKELPGVVHFQELNPHIDLEGAPFYIVDRTTEWPRLKDERGHELPRVAGVSSFGFGGANAHVVLEEYGKGEEVQESVQSNGECPKIVVLSARDRERLGEYVRTFLGWMETSEKRERTPGVIAAPQELIDEIRCALAGVLGVAAENVEADGDFNDYGMDEVKLASFSELLNERYSTDLTIESCIGVDTVERLAAYMLDRYPDRFADGYPALETEVEESERHAGTLDIERIAYTLQVGRDAMNERLAVVARDAEELASKLHSYLDGKGAIEGLHAENAKAVTDKDAVIGRDEADEHYIHDLFERGNQNKIAALWASGSDIDWESFYAEKPERISLPTYPFRRDRHWIPETDGGAVVGDARTSHLHEMIDSNESTLDVQCYRKVLHGREYYLRDHVVGGVKVLPGVAYLEMARLSGEFAGGGSKVHRISDVVWSQPVAVRDGVAEVCLSLYPDDGVVEYEVTSGADDGAERVVNSQGRIWYGDAEDRGAMDRLDLEGIRNRCPDIMEGEVCYRIFKERGLAYGPAFRTIRELRHNDLESLASLELPSDMEGSFGEYVLHPSLMDGSLQAVMGVMGDVGDGIYLPFSLGEVEIVRPLETKCHAYVRARESNKGEMLRFDIDIANLSGEVLVRLKDFAMRSYGKKALNAPGKDSAKPAERMLYLVEDWTEEDIDGEAEPLSGVVLYVGKDEVLCETLNASVGEKAKVIRIGSGDAYGEFEDGTYAIRPGDVGDYEKLTRSLRSKDIHPDKIVYVFGGGEFVDGSDETNVSLETGVYSLFGLTRALMEGKPKDKIKILCAVRNETVNPIIGGLAGFARSANLENSRFQYKLVSFETDVSNEELSQKLGDELTKWGKRGVAEIKYGGAGRYERRLKENERNMGAEGKPVLKEGGTYVITGGMGGLGVLFAKYLSESYKARLVLSGRRERSPDIDARLDEIGALGGRAIYVACDVTSFEDVDALLMAGREEYGRIDGVIHAAGLLRDALIAKKTREDMEAVIAPKVYGAINLHKASREDDLDIFVMFSSIAGVMGNPGQSDYAYANRFMDGFAEWRNGQAIQGMCKGKTISIDWSLWKDAGMVVDDETKKWMEQTIGMKLLEESDGIHAFEVGLREDRDALAIMYGDVQKMEKFLGIASEEGSDASPESPAIVGATEEDSALFDNLERDIVKLVSDILKVKEGEVNIEDDMSDYGFDSITVTNFANRINAQFNLTLAPAIFFEHFTIDSLLKYLLAQYGNALRDYYNVDTDMGSAAAAAHTAPDTLQRVRRSRFRSRGDTASSASAAIGEPIAVIGMSGVFPQSSDLNEFWEHLEKSEDLISEIPADRWDWREYYGDSLTKENQTKSKWGGFMKEVDKFDAAFFNISQREAELMDPQQRIFLQAVWKSIEDAGYRAKNLSGTKTGLFVGVSSADYREVLQEAGVNVTAYMPTGLAHSVLANRISYLLNIHGPSEPIDTACSSSLIALHRAVRAMHDGDCEMAIAGGVNVILTPALHIAFGQAGMLSEDGRCKTFDKRADGYVRGEGVGAVLLKPLSRAINDGDHIYGVIRGTGENHGGHVNALTVPNPVAQADLIADVYNRAGIEPWRIGYIECHGTGTSLGDPVEINGLKRAFAELYRRHGKEFSGKPYCGLGTVKTNIGHLEAAAGIAGFIKALLSMNHERLPGIVNFEELNPQIEISDSPFYLVEKTIPWERVRGENGEARPRVLGVSSFGFGGANAHIVVEEYIERSSDSRKVRQGEPSALILLSAKDEGRLKDYAKEVVAYLDGLEVETDFDLDDVAYTLQVGRDALDERLAVVVSSLEELSAKLHAYVSGEKDIDQLYSGNTKPSEGREVPIDDEEEETEFAERLFSKGKFKKLATLWVKGLEIDWEEFYEEAMDKPHRVSLPTHPFAGKRFWPGERKAKTALHVERKGEKISNAAVASSGDECSSLDDIVRSIVEIVASRSTHETDEVERSMGLRDLGVDSVAMLEIAGDIISRFPFLESKGSDFLKSFESTTIEDMARYVYENRNAEPAAVRIEASREDLNELNSSQKRDRQNVICDSVALIKDNPLEIEGRLVVDEKHPFFFDHPLDHISGMQLVESMNQICSLAYLLEAKPGGDKDICLIESRVSFRNFCKKDVPAIVGCVSEKNADGVYKSEIVQGDKIISSGVLRYAGFDRLKYSGKASAAGKRGSRPKKIVPCPCDIVNKVNDENVIISRVEENKMGTGCWMLTLKGHSFFSDVAGEVLDGAQLLEACRQSLRAIEYYLRRKGKNMGDFSQENKMALLRDMKMSLSRPVGNKEAVFIKSGDPVITRVGDNILVKYRASILADSVDIGSCEISAMVLDKEVYKGWRNDGTNASLKMKE